METFNEVISTLLSVVILPAIPILVKYLVDALRAWSERQGAEFDNATASRYLSEITDTVAQAVTCTTQTYVDTLKAQGKFDEAAQKVAFQKTKENVLLLLTKEAKDFISMTYGDLNLWIDSKVEQMVKETKK